MVKNQYPNSHHQAMDGEFKKPHPLSTFMPPSANKNNSQAVKCHKMNQKMNIFNNMQLINTEPGRPGNHNTVTTTTFKSMSKQQQQHLNSLTSSTKSNKSALSALSSITNTSSYRSTCGNDGNIVVIEVGVDDVGIDVGTIEDRLLLGSTSPSASSPSSLSSSSSPNTSQSNSLSFKNKDNNANNPKLTISNNDSDEHTDHNILSSESILLDVYNARANNQLDSSPISFAGSHHQERGIDCPDYFVPEIKQKPCYPPSLLQQAPPTPVSDPMDVFTDAKQPANKKVSLFESDKSNGNKKTSKSSKSSAKAKKDKLKCNADKVTTVVLESKLDTSQLNLLQETSQDSFVADVATKVSETIPDKATVITAPPFQHTFGQSSLRFIDDDSKSKLFSNNNTIADLTSTNTVNQLPTAPTTETNNKLNLSFESTTKYCEFTFDSPNNKPDKPKIKPKPTNLSLDTFEQVINDLNDPKPIKASLGKKLFEKQQRSSEENERLVNTSFSNDDTLNFDKEFSASMLSSTVKQQQCFTKRNSIRQSNKSKKANAKKNSISYDDKPIVLFNGSDGLVNNGFNFDEDSTKKTVPVTKIKLSSQDLVVQSSNLIRPPTPPPRADKPLSFFNANESNNYNLNFCDDSLIDKTCYKSNSNLSMDNKLQIKENDTHESSEINEIFEKINIIQTQLESTKPTTQQSAAVAESPELKIINNLYEAQDSKSTLDLYNKIISLSKKRDMKPAQTDSFRLVQEIMSLIERSSSKKLILDSSSCDNLSSEDGCDLNERAIDAMSMSQATTETTDELYMLLNKLDVKNVLLTHDQIAERSEQEVLERQKANEAAMQEQQQHSSESSQDPDNLCGDDTLKMLDNSNKSSHDSFDGTRPCSYEQLNNEASFEKCDMNEYNNMSTPENDFTAVLTEEGKYLLQKAAHYSVENLKLVNIEKTETPLGATIRNQDGSIVIGRIVNGGAAEKSGLLHEEDEILEINSVPVRGKTINDICEMLFNIQGIVSFLIIPNMDYEPGRLHGTMVGEGDVKIDESSVDNILHIRALYNYVPMEDIYVPCKELGLGFNKGDILHVISKEDGDWWQAYRDEDKEQALAGLIPSQSFQERRCSQMRAFIGDSFMDRKKRQKGFCMKTNTKGRRRRMLENMNEFNHETVTYEQVTLYKPPANSKRPIVLIGPHSIGRHELRKRLMQVHPSLFEVAVPHTTRTARRDEFDGKDYHFLPRHIFEADIKQGRFIEHGEFEKNLYGTSHESIKKVIDNNRVCVLNLYPQALKTLRDSNLMPYIIYIGPSNLAKLKDLKTKMNESYRENDLLDIIDKGREIEETYGHFFDKIIRNSDMDKTYEELFETIQSVQNEENWVPVKWLKKTNNNNLKH